jgi:hypothetical protein
VQNAAAVTNAGFAHGTGGLRLRSAQPCVGTRS